MSETVVILGSTGSVGVNVLDVIRRHPDKYRVVGLTAKHNLAVMRQQCLEFRPDAAALADPAAARHLQDELRAAGSSTQALGGDDASCDLAASGADIVVCGIVGGAGLPSTLAAVRAGKKILIANKEPLVMLGQLIMREARASGAAVIPLDSEHNAIFQCLPRNCLPQSAGDDSGDPGGPGDSNDAGDPTAVETRAGIRSILLTGSGGPFRQLPLADFCRVTPQQACAHPTWEMGPKISVDSATMMNKGLELIEASALFSIHASDIKIVIHPQSIVHSMVEYVDGSVLAQLGSPDMRVPIACALGWPRRIASGARRLSLIHCARLDFEAPDHRRFPSLELARAAARAGGAMPAIMNAANEVAVEAFLSHALSFEQIPRLVERVMALADAESGGAHDLAGALAADQQARRMCRELLPAGAAPPAASTRTSKRSSSQRAPA